MKKILLITFLLLTSGLITACNLTNNQATQWYFPAWAENAKYNEPIRVLDTESALGRYAARAKSLSLKDLALVHGHLCDGLVISYIELKAALELLFPDGVVDRTDINVVSKNGPCWVDAASMMTGARINFATLSIQPEVGNGFIVQKKSTGEAYEVHLKDGVFPQELADLESKIRESRAENKSVELADIDRVELLANNLSKKLLNISPVKILDVKKLDKYVYEFNFQTAKRGDIINKDISN